MVDSLNKRAMILQEEALNILYYLVRFAATPAGKCDN